MPFKDIIKNALPDLDSVTFNKLLKQLEGVGKQVLIDESAKLVSRALLKGIDSVIAVSVANLTPDDAEELAATYTEALAEQFADLSEAAFAYIPLQLAVEVAKQDHGNNSTEANVARKLREAGIKEMRQEVRDVLLSAVGQDPVD